MSQWTIRYTPLFVALLGVGGLWAWSNEYLHLVSFGLDNVTQKPLTAAGMIFSGLAYFFLQLGPMYRRLTHAFSSLDMAHPIMILVDMELKLGVVSAWGHAARDTMVDTPIPGMPALTTLLSLLLLGVHGHYSGRWTPITVFVIAAVAVIGHITGLPYLYGHFEHIASGMAIPTALEFIMLSMVGYAVHDQQAQFGLRHNNQDCRTCALNPLSPMEGDEK